MKKTDWVYLALCVLCSAVSCLALASIGYAQGGFSTDELGNIVGLGKYGYAVKQAAGAAIGVLCAFVISAIDYRGLARIWPVHVILTWGAVLPTLFLHNFPSETAPFIIGYSAGNGSENYSWYKLGGFTVQPTEFAKISFILTFAMHLDNVRSRMNE
ncbi:MAG: FtsW/RodA/SpoVE family cell cycle protein, partial [Faecalibacterium sp.]|nr:FtsW/RodA/SpoVE family cell cycle protein [Faecalibacterium sp.]